MANEIIEVPGGQDEVDKVDRTDTFEYFPEDFGGKKKK
jgi:hypothetical protein